MNQILNTSKIRTLLSLAGGRGLAATVVLIPAFMLALTAPCLAQEASVSEPATPAESGTVATPVSVRLPVVLTTVEGLKVRAPKGWTMKSVGGQGAAMIPPAIVAGAETESEGSTGAPPRTAYLAYLTPWPSAMRIASPEVSGALAQLISLSSKGVSVVGGTEALSADPADGVRLRFDGPGGTKLRAYVRHQGEQLAILVGLGATDELQLHEAEAKDMLSVLGTSDVAQSGASDATDAATALALSAIKRLTTRFAPEKQAANKTPANIQSVAPESAAAASRDPAVIGTWRSSESFSDSRAGASLAIEKVYVLNADGTYSYGSQAAGGNANIGMDTGFKVSATGRWSTSGGFLETTATDGSRGRVKYLFHDGQLVFKHGEKRYTFWSR